MVHHMPDLPRMGSQLPSRLCLLALQTVRVHNATTNHVLRKLPAFSVLTDGHCLQASPEHPVLLNGASQARSSLDGALPAKHSRSADSGNAGLDAKTRDMLQKLSELSSSLVRDSKEDDKIFRPLHRESLD